MGRSAKLTLAIAVLVAFAVGAFFAWRGIDDVPRSAIHLRLPSFALNLHPLKMADVESRSVATLLYAGLAFQDDKGETRPLLARGWTRSGSDWEFTLRQGLTFSDGTPVTAEDVVASLCAAMQPASPWAWALASITHASAPDGKTQCTGLAVVTADRIRIKEERSVPWLLDALSGPAGWIMPASTPEPGAFGVMPGAGPYRVREIVPDVKVVLEARREGSPITPGVNVIQFDYLPDDLVAANRFANGALDVLDLTTPQLVDAMTERPTGKLKYPGTVVETDWDRIRVAIVNEKALLARGFSSEQTRAFIDTFSASVDRKRIADLSRGVGEPLAVPFLPAPNAESVGKANGTGLAFPDVRLTIITESDAYSDLIGASMPKRIRNVAIGYKGVEKGLLIDSLIKGDYDIAIVPIEATAHSPAFWKNFFVPGSPLSVFGKPIAALKDVDVSTQSGVAEAARRIAESGNWVAIIRERRLQAIAPGVVGIAYTASGQTNYAFIRRE